MYTSFYRRSAIYAFLVSVYRRNGKRSLIRVFRYSRYMSGREWTNPVRADGNVCIVTGATSGIGRETALGLAKRGCHVVLACRDLKLANAVRAEICQRVAGANVAVHELDLASLRSVRKFAAEYRELYGTRRLDVLVLNAGVMGVPWHLTEDGLETHMAVNHYGHFALTLLLLDRLQATPRSRIIVVSSKSHRWVRLRPDDMNGKRRYNRFHAYAHSKLANAMFTAALAQREGLHGVTVNCLHPGVIHTAVSRNLKSLCWILQENVCAFFTYIFLRSAKSGAKCTLYTALDFNLQFMTGYYFE